MADWNFYGWTANEDTAADASSAVAISSASALAFGGGASNAFQTNITINVWNTAMHWAKDTAESSTDYCNDTHLWPIKPDAVDFTSRSTGAVVRGEYVNMASGTPDPARGIGLKFTHGFGVKCNPVTIWGGIGAAVDSDPQSCYIAMVDLTSANPTWSTVKPSSKLSLKIHGTEAEEHWWNVGVAVQPLVVGHNGENKIKVETVYY